MDDLIDFARKNPKIVAVLVIVILVFVGMNMLPSGSNNSSGQGVYDTSVYGVNFHMPGKYIENDPNLLTVNMLTLRMEVHSLKFLYQQILTLKKANT